MCVCERVCVCARVCVCMCVCMCMSVYMCEAHTPTSRSLRCRACSCLSSGPRTPRLAYIALVVGMVSHIALDMLCVRQLRACIALHYEPDSNKIS